MAAILQMPCSNAFVIKKKDISFEKGYGIRRGCVANKKSVLFIEKS